MRWGWSVALCALAVVTAWPRASAAAGPSLTARAAGVMDAATGRVLWEHNGGVPLAPASTTKVMTAILALESGRLEERFRVSAHAAAVAPSKIGLRPGQQMRLRSLLYALLLKSANDAALVVAEGLAGSERAFADRMTSRAHAIGARTARFVNPHGLTAPRHVASARDLATIFRYALRDARFREILETRSKRVAIESPRVRWLSIHSHNRLLRGHAYRVIGKTGYTRAARRCFVGSTRDGAREIVVALLGATDLWGDAKRLVGHGLRVARLPSAPPTTAAREPARGREVAPEDDADPAASGQGDRGEEASRYTVQLGPFADPAGAFAARAQLERQGYGAVVEGRRLRLGSFATRSRAERFARRLRSSGHHPRVEALE
jgi:D-alanyl-D-alanine carboxypeptidase